MRQRVLLIARAFARRPPPAADGRGVRRARGEITRDRLERGTAPDLAGDRDCISVFVTHSVYEALYLGEQVLVLAANPGRVHRTDHRRLAARDRT